MVRRSSPHVVGRAIHSLDGACWGWYGAPSMQLDLIRPFFLVLLLAVLPLWWAHRKSLVDLPGRQRWWSLGVRATILALLMLAAAGLSLGIASGRQQVIFLVDRSASIAEDVNVAAFVEEAVKEQRSGDRFAVMQFAEQVTPAAESAWTNALPEGWADRGTELGLGLQAALANLDPGYGGRIVVCTDGVTTGSDPSPILQSAQKAGKRVDFVPLPSTTQAEVQLTSVRAPNRVHSGEPFPLEVKVRAGQAGAARLVIYENGIKAHTEEVSLTEGENTIALRQIAGEERIVRYRVALEADNDGFLDNNTGSALVRTTGKPKALLIEARPQDGKHLRWALKQEDIDLEVRSPRGVPRSMAELRNVDLVIFSDVGAHEVSEQQMKMIRSYVRDFGGGFMMLGGDNSFGLGGYYKTVLEDILPVRTDFERERETPSLGMVLVIDKSGSMSGVKIELAKEAAKAAAELLDARDQLGVLAFDGQPRWVCEMHSAADQGYILDRISSLQAGGGTDMGPALASAYSALEMLVSTLKHVIVMTDGHSSPANFYDLVSAMRGSGMTVSSVGVGDGADQELLSRIADWGEGRYYFTSDPLTIPQIFARETMTASRSALQETPFLAQPVMAHPVLQGINLSEAPFLLGYVVTKPKPTCELVMATERGDPLLAFWRFGLGNVGAFTSDAKNRWAAEWMEWPGYSKFWAQVCRSVMRSEAMQGMQVQVKADGDDLRVTADLPADAGLSRSADEDVRMTVMGPDLAPQEVVLEQEAPGRYVAVLKSAAEGDYHVQVMRTVAGQVMQQADAGYSQGYPEELKIRPTDREALERWATLAGGRFEPAAEAVFGEERLRGYRVIRLWPWLLGAALLLLPVDIALRRLELLPDPQGVVV